MNTPDKWNKMEEWRQRGKNFLVIIKHWAVEPAPKGYGYLVDHEGLERWAVYAYIYPQHPRFAVFTGEDIWQKATELPFHKGCTFCRIHYAHNGPNEDVSVVSYQCGADYNHLHDEQYTNIDTREEATKVFRDAQSLFDVLMTEAG